MTDKSVWSCLENPGNVSERRDLMLRLIEKQLTAARRLSAATRDEAKRIHAAS